MNSDRRDHLHPWDSGVDSPPDLPARDDGTCLGSTCMKWVGTGELAPQDLQAILARLSAVDHEASGLMECQVDPT